MASTGKITIVLGAALGTPQSVKFEDVAAFAFGTIPEVIQFVPAGAELPTGGSSATKPTTRGKRPNVIIPNPPKVWRKKGTLLCSKPETAVPLAGGRTNLHPILEKKDKQDCVMAGGRMRTSPLRTQGGALTFTEDKEDSVLLIVNGALATRVFSNPENARKRERQQERKKRARQNKGQCSKPSKQARLIQPICTDDNLFNLLRMVKKNAYATTGLKLRVSPGCQADSRASRPVDQKKNILKNAYDVYKAARRNKAGQRTPTTKKGISRSQFPSRRTRENYEVHTVRVIEDSDLPQTHEAAPARDRIVTRSQSSRLTATPRKDSLSIAAEESTSTPRIPSAAREEEPEEAPQTQSMTEVAENNTQLLVTILNQIQNLSIQLSNTNQRVSDLQDYIFRQGEPPALQNPVIHPTNVPSGPHHKLSSALPTEQMPASAKTRDASPGQGSLIPQQPFPLANQPKEKGIYMTKEEVQQLIASQLKQGETGITRRMGRPYPAEYDAVPYPLGYAVPKFKSFNGIGNPVQHLAHFVATCGNTGSNDALLLRQFSQSLTGVAFEWYYSLESGSIRTWAEMEDSFTSKFASISDTVDITTLVNTRMKKDESPVDYITRWRNLSIRCEHPLDQAYAVDTVIANIDNWMSPFLRSNKARTFQELITQVSRLEKSKVPSAPSQFPPPRFRRA